MNTSDESALLPSPDCTWREWFVPIKVSQLTLREAMDTASHLAADQNDIPLIVRLIENPKFNIPGVNIFEGAVDLFDHDAIHILLGRGMLPKDEAFVIGFTMGSTNRVGSAEQKLYSLAAKYLYPGPYKFSDEDIQVFKDGVHLGYVSDCLPLNTVRYKDYLDKPIGAIRKELGIEEDLVEAYYRIEQKRYPDSMESQRLLD
jgi:hypothetical protein